MSLNLNLFVHQKVFSVDPLVTFTSFCPKSIPLFDLIESTPDLFKGRKGVHLLSSTWDMELSNLKYVKNVFQEMRDKYPEHQFVVAATSEMEAFLFSQNQIENIVCNHSIFQDESVWKPSNQYIDQLPFSDSIYVARLLPFKRHQLCSLLHKPLFVYGIHPLSELENRCVEIKNSCPDAIFVNHLLSPDSPKLLDEHTLSKVLNHAKVSLCLSKVEGAMRSSIQSLLCGLPVVSTRCIGGRERYYSDDVALYVEDDPKSVQEGVQTLIKRNLKREEVREHVLKYIRYDRKNFIDSFNKIINYHFKIEGFQLPIQEFIGIKFRQKKIKNLIESLKS